MSKQIHNKNAWGAAYKEEPQQFTEPDKISGLAETLFKKNNVRNILDLGCGNGRHLIFFEKKEFRMFGTDLSYWGLEAARTWQKKEGLSSKLALADMQHIPYVDKSFDAVISFRVIQHNLIKDIIATFDEIHRVLRENGLFIFDLLRFDPDTDRFNQSEMVEPRTYIPADGIEKGLPHHAFTKEEIFAILNEWQIKFIEAIGDERHYSVIAQKR